VTFIYHIALACDWELALASGQYTTSTRDVTLAEQGFIHAGTARQVAWVANRFYQDAPDLLLLVIDAGLLTAPLQYDDVPGSDEPFPHIYGPLNPGAVIEALPFAPGPDGTFTFEPPG
jgi:glutathione S-transferase